MLIDTYLQIIEKQGSGLGEGPLPLTSIQAFDRKHYVNVSIKNTNGEVLSGKIEAIHENVTIKFWILRKLRLRPTLNNLSNLRDVCLNYFPTALCMNIPNS
jgi:hypothetical protein